MSAQPRVTRTLLSCGVSAGPFFLLIFAIQVFARSEFQFTRSEPSMLSLGPWGWIQIANFVIGGLLIIAGALGVRKALRTRRGSFLGFVVTRIFWIPSDRRGSVCHRSNTLTDEHDLSRHNAPGLWGHRFHRPHGCLFCICAHVCVLETDAVGSILRDHWTSVSGRIPQCRQCKSKCDEHSIVS